MHSARLAFLFLQRRIGADALAWTGGLISAVLLRYDCHAGRVGWAGFAVLAAAAVVIQVVAGLATGLYLGRWRLGSFDEVSALARTVAWVSSILFLVELRQSHRFVPLSVMLGGGVIAFVLMGSARYFIRSYDEERRRPTGPDVRRLLVVGVDVAIGDNRTPTAEDLLGRQPVDTDVASIAEYLRGRRVLVTGAGGSIGSELCRQIAGFEPANLIMVDRDESALHAVQLSIEGRALLDSPDLVLLDLRDRDGMERFLRQRRPEVIFHAAALQHLPLLERYPGEAVQSNVWLTAHLLAAAAEVGVEKFVNISTDKAADPTSVLGYSKRIAERLTAHFAEHASGSFVSVRFGNVLGSRGSVLHAFRAQIEAGGPVTVTDPQVTRYFMTVHEAVQLVIQAAAVNGQHEPGEPDVGDAPSALHGH